MIFDEIEREMIFRDHGERLFRLKYSDCSDEEYEREKQRLEWELDMVMTRTNMGYRDDGD